MPKPVVLILCDYFLPGCKAGGPVRSLANMVSRLCAEFDFHVVTRDRDFGDTYSYPNVVTNCWSTVETTPVYYTSNGLKRLLAIRYLLKKTPHTILYLNSLFSLYFSIFPLLLKFFGLIAHRSVVLAPRGELSEGALKLKSFKKIAFIYFAKLIRLHHGITWQASSSHEEKDIRRWFGPKARVMVASNIPAAVVSDQHVVEREPKYPGQTKILFLSRICEMKNLDFALESLQNIRGHIEFNIVGPMEDEHYWNHCQKIIEGLPGNITVNNCGAVTPPQVSEIMRSHDLLFLPTRGENFGHVILEAMVAGCPVLISDCTPWTGLKEVDAGWDIPLSDHDAFRSVLQQIVDSDEQAHATWREQARNHARRFCENESLVEQNIAIFRKAA